VLQDHVGPHIVVSPGYRVMVPLGFKTTLPYSTEAQIRPRSGTAYKKGLSIINTPGTIDEDYPGEWAVLLVNLSNAAVRVDNGERIAQMVLAKYEVEGFYTGKVVPRTERVGGFGSTGT
jgi:dUTP pyrophosphatase